ncbi:hypothetical protein F5Y18DRAFT_437327 [Xylariaceae sp. FL1019]|nr:hypothetical protein F5Y18DRAFT_437327 [Xylariaceae sp. FL1019]
MSQQMMKEDVQRKTEVDLLTPPTTPTTPTSAVSGDTAVETIGTPTSPVIMISGKPYSAEKIAAMGAALETARRSGHFPQTRAASYNVQAVIDDYEDLQRLNAALRQTGQVLNMREHATHPVIGPLYVTIQRRIQDRDTTEGEYAAEANVRARIQGFANGVAAETGIYNLMRHAVHAVLRNNGLTNGADRSIVDAVSARVINDIRPIVQAQADRGANGVTHENMNHVIDNVFDAIQGALGEFTDAQGFHARIMHDVTHDQRTATDELLATTNDQRRHSEALRAVTDDQRVLTDDQRVLTDDQRRLNDAHRILAESQTAQINAIGGHANAIDGQVRSLGTNINAMSTLLTSTNGSLSAINNNVDVMRTMLNMIPQMIADAVRQMIPEVLPQIMGPAVQGAIEHAITDDLVAGMQGLVNVLAQRGVPASVSVSEKGGVKNGKASKKSGNKKNRKGLGGFFKGLFGKGGRKDDGASGAGAMRTV